MSQSSSTPSGRPLRIGAVAYLNAQPLTGPLAEFLPEAEIVVDLPSRLATALAEGRLDVALIPLIEFFRIPGATIVSDACVACEGPVQSVKLFGRVPIRRVRSLALDEGSRTSAAMTRLFLKERFGLEPELEELAIGDSLDDSSADAVLLIGDRAMLPAGEQFEFVWDLGEKWDEWIGLPFVFAMWVARPGVETDGLEAAFAAARDVGVRRFEEIARAESPRVGVPEEVCLTYLRDNLHFHLGPRERDGLETFFRLAGEHGLVPSGEKLVFDDHKLA